MEDVLSPIILHFNFSLAGEPIPSSQNLRPVLAVGSQDLFTASVSLLTKSQGCTDFHCISVCFKTYFGSQPHQVQIASTQLPRPRLDKTLTTCPSWCPLYLNINSLVLIFQILPNFSHSYFCSFFHVVSPTWKTFPSLHPKDLL